MQSLGDFFSNNRLLSAAILLVLAVLVVAVLVAAYRLLFGGRLKMAGGRTRQPRLGLVDAFDLDRQRQLVLVRRDNVEHLLMIGGPNDVVVETSIVRSATTQVRDTGAIQPTVAIPPAAPIALPDQPSAPTPSIAPPLSTAMSGPSVRLPELSSGPATPPPASAPLPAPGVSVAATGERAGPGFTPRPVPPANGTAPPRSAVPLPPRQPAATSVPPTPRATPTTALPPRQPPIPPLPRQVTSPTRPPGATAGLSTSTRAPDAKTPEATPAGASPPPATKPPEPQPARRPEQKAANDTAPPQPPAESAAAPQPKTDQGSRPSSPTPGARSAESAAAATKPPVGAPRPGQPPVRSVDALESLEEEMAKLLGRPATPPDR